MSAKDEDGGRNGEVKYEMVGEESSPFTVDETSGEVKIVKRLDREVAEIHR